MADSVVLVAEDIEEDYMLLERAFKQAAIPARLHWARDGYEAKAYLELRAPSPTVRPTLFPSSF